MSQMRKLASAGVVALALGASVMASNGSAVADPNPAGFRTYSAVGSDTIQAVWNGLTNGKKAAIANVASYDATPAGTNIQTRADGPSFLRPTGSGAGIRALSGAWDPANHSYAGVTLSPEDVAFARSSSRPSGSGTALTYLPFARDAVSVAVNEYASGTSIDDLSTAQLTAIYGGPTRNTGGTGVTYDPDSGQPVLNGHILFPLLPQSSSGTRSFFLAAIGVTTPADYIDANSAIIENDGSYLPDDGDLIPFSAAQWIAQVNKVQTNTTSGLSLTEVNDKAPFTSKKKTLVAGPLFGSTKTAPTPGVGVFARDTYNVIPSEDLQPGASASQTALVQKLTGSAKGQLGNSKAQKVLTTYGFLTLSYFGKSAQYLTGPFVH